MEIWRDIQGYEGLYQVSNLGRVRSLDRVVIRSDGRRRTYKGRILKLAKSSNEYLTVRLSKNGVGGSECIHVLVAQAFIPNPHGYTVAHHKNHNRQDNRTENLVWMDFGKHSAMHAKESKSMRVDQTDKVTGEVLYQWKSSSDVERELGFRQSLISTCCRGGYFNKSRNKWVNITQAYDYVWKYQIIN